MDELQANLVQEAADQMITRKGLVYDAGPICGKTGIEGLFWDFYCGARIRVPAGNWRVKIIDRDAWLTLFDSPVSNAFVSSAKKYYVNFRIEVYRDNQLVFEHNLDLKGKSVLFYYPLGVLGDIIAWFPYARRFQERHGCQVYCMMDAELAALFRTAYPELRFISHDERPEKLYAVYNMGAFTPYDERNYLPVDWRITGLQKTAAYLLGLKAEEVRPKIMPQNPERRIKEPYVCIAAQSTMQAKYWNNPAGWIKTVEYLKAKGYRVLCIDKQMINGAGSRWNTIPYGAEDFTGGWPLDERVELLYYADFFIGLASGLSWLAWAVGRPVVMISGFSLPYMEFYTPYRIINPHVCNGCFTDTSIECDTNDFAWCPRHKNTDRQFECTRFIAHNQVFAAIERLMEEHHLNPKQRAENFLLNGARSEGMQF